MADGRCYGMPGSPAQCERELEDDRCSGTGPVLPPKMGEHSGRVRVVPIVLQIAL
jgi:hypothetical protein